MTYIYNAKSNQTINQGNVGGKAYNLSKLTKSGLPVPAWFVVTADVYDIVKASCGSISKKLTADHIPEDVKKEIEAALEDVKSDQLFAVRSSAVGEDSISESFAGQFKSLLFVPKEDVFQAIVEVWNSANQENVKFYLQQNNLSQENLKVCVVVQEMVNAEISGVSFSIDPISGNTDCVTISSVYGLGEGLVSGLLDADTYRINDGEIKSTIVKKDEYLGYDKSTRKGLKSYTVPIDKQGISSLSDQQIHMICEITKQIDTLYQLPMDIEWAISNNKLYILQARPVTAIYITETASSGEKIIWDNSNITESYADLTLPLTFSFIRPVYCEVYKQFCLILGVEKQLISDNENVFEMLGLIEGRVYYNLLSWYKVLMLLPGYSINASFMEQMMGVKEPLTEKPSIVESKRNPYLRLVTLISKIARNTLTLPKQVKRFYCRINETLGRYENTDLSQKSPNNLLSIYYELEQKLLRNWQAPLVNDFFAMIYYGILKKLISKWSLDEHVTLQNDLLAGGGDIISTEPIRRMYLISNRIIENQEAYKLFADNSPDVIWDCISKYPEVKNDIDEYVQKFGDRCVCELKLETITYKQNPAQLINLIKSYVRQGFKDPEELGLHQQKLRANAESVIKERLKRKPVKRFLFNHVLNKARLYVTQRENLRFERTRLYGVIREIFLAIGKHFYRYGTIENARDIFYLTKDEVFSYIIGTASLVNLRELVSLRKKEYEAFSNKSLPDRFETCGVVYERNQYLSKTSSDTEDAGNDGSDLSGTGCCPGIIKAKIRFVGDPLNAPDLNDCIMVAKRTDPGWVPIMAVSKGILIERGSILSHSAIVAREMGIPAIVGITNLMDRLRDGSIVEMDGSAGTIKILEAETVNEE
jgi:phosphohistidine swiveling domain-containing protein